MHLYSALLQKHRAPPHRAGQTEEAGGQHTGKRAQELMGFLGFRENSQMGVDSSTVNWTRMYPKRDFRIG